MIKYHINNELTKLVKEKIKLFPELTFKDHVRLYDEVKNATLQGIDDKLVELSKTAQNSYDNKCNSLLLWVLEIVGKDDKPTEAQKIKSEGSYADVDLDFPQNKREKVFKYLEEKYGKNRAVHIATFGRMGAKASIRNGARALGYPVAIGEMIAKLISNDPNATIQSSIDSNKDLEQLIVTNPDVKKVIDVAKKLEGLPNSIGMHASGFVLSDKPITEYLPLMTATRKDDAQIMTQWEYKDVEANGNLKWDILGLQTLDIIKETIELVKKFKGIDIKLSELDVTDPKVYDFIKEGNVTLVFQLDGSMASYIPKWKPDNIMEVSDLSATARPGPLEMGLVEKYIEAKFYNKKYDYGLKDTKLIEKLWEICENSYGLLLFQEQLIKCFVELADFNEIEADNARRATGKKKPEEMKALGDKFIPRAVAKGYSEDDIKLLFEQFQSFSSYSFNLSHSLAYSYISFYTAYLSCYYPLEFYTAALSVCSDNTDDVRRFIKSIKDRGYKLLAPDINTSTNEFNIVEDGILFGLNAIKGVGASVSKKILGRKPKSGYKSLGHFIRRNIDLLNSKILESYTKAGCFKSLGFNKESIIESIPNILEFLSIYKEYNKYNTIFDLCNIPLDEYIEEFVIKRSDKEDDLFYEIDSLGLYISKHPLDDYEVQFNRNFDVAVNQISYMEYFEDNEEFVTVGCISGIAVRKTKAKLNMCSFYITDSMNAIKCIMFPKAYSKYLSSDLLEEGKLVRINGRIKKEETGKILIVNDLYGDADRYIKKVRNNNRVEFVINSDLKFILEK